MHLRRLFLLAGLVALLAACGGGSKAPATGSLVDIGAGLQGPSGVKASVYATGLPNVAALAFDDQGRLWAGTAAFTDDGTDGVYVITQPGATPQLVLSGQHTVLGLLWYRGELYVSSKESVDAYANFDGSRFVMKRQVLSLPSGVGEVNGLAVSPEARLVLGVSAPCNACVSPSQYSAAVLSFLPDGSDLRVDDANIRAPIDFAYYPGTSDLFVTMNQRDDLGDDTPGDWLAVIKPGEDWRFPDCYGQGGSVCQGVPGPVAVLDPHAAVSGVAILPGASGSNAYAVVAEWAKAKLLKVDLAKSRSGYSGKVSTFVTGLQAPVPVIQSSDGKLYVGDWKSGTVYLLENV